MIIRSYLLFPIATLPDIVLVIVLERNSLICRKVSPSYSLFFPPIGPIVMQETGQRQKIIFSRQRAPTEIVTVFRNGKNQICMMKFRLIRPLKLKECNRGIPEIHIPNSSELHGTSRKPEKVRHEPVRDKSFFLSAQMASLRHQQAMIVKKN